MAMMDTLDRGWTQHGHAIKGVVQVEPQPPVARCGGPSMCSKCALDASQAQQRQIDDIEERTRLANIGQLVLHHTLSTTPEEPERRFLLVYDGVVYGFTVQRDAPIDRLTERWR